MTTRETPVLLLHGFWHGTWCWSEVLARLTAAGTRALAVDMAGHGLRARRPAAPTARPFDPAALAAEPSPADADLDEAAALFIAQARALGGGAPVTAVAHSMGGNVLTRAVQEAPGLFAHAVYVTAFMPASGVPAAAYIFAPENAGDLVQVAMVADPAAIGGLRLDTASPDPSYRQLLRDAFFGDVGTDVADAAVGAAHPGRPRRHRRRGDHAHRRRLGLGPAHVRHVHAGPRAAADDAAQVHRARRRRLSWQPHCRAHAGVLALPVPVDAGRARRHHPQALTP
jgi:pimeloyl-ACP methyl ester carboxylesterase